MKIFVSDEIFLSFGPFNITYYALFIITGVIVAYELSQATMKKWKYSTSVLEDYVVPMMFCGIIGARLYYVLFQWDYYSKFPEEIIKIWHGGLAIHGGLIAGVLFSLYYFKKKKVSIYRMMDCILPNVLIAQAFGRWGNFMNQEAFGSAVSESFINHFPSFIKNRMYINGQYHHPTFLYESVANVIGFFLIRWIRKKGLKKQGDAGFLYLIWYGMVRFFIEGLRTDSLMLGPLRIAQVVSLLFVVAGILGILGVGYKYAKPVILFDLDGTLQDSQKMIYETFIQVFKERKPEIELTQEELNAFFGPTLEVSFGKYFEENEIEDVIQRYQEINKELHYTMLKEIDHATEVLKTLKEEGYTLGIVSNKRISAVQLGVQINHFEPYFDVILGKEDLPIPKPSGTGLIEACSRLNVSRDNVIYVGDAKSDILCAKDVAMTSIGFSLDENRREQMKEANPDYLISDLRDCISICKEKRTWNDTSIW
ncbi:prolipoprotein diacylglyceryl transferase [Floccifex sp.]|uniref:prolipoprotein diacylglyceryl transferase n=1 Tax=Floccifex sp. TaxID=2815810 RepID=UPI003F015D67